MNVHDLPALNASLNGLSGCFLLAGYIFIRRQRQDAHRNCMIAAFITSAIFLVSYITYHYAAGTVTRFQGQGLIRPIYFFILITHIILAGLIVPLALVTLWFALRRAYATHRRIARWTWPIWMYVSVTGVIVYLMLYQLYPAR